MTKVIGLTGGIGSGKSLVSEIFKILNIPIYHADIEAKKCYENPDFLIELREVFGNPVFFESGEVNKAAIAQIVFNNPNELKKLNALIHPMVKKDFKEWVKKQHSPYVIQENAIIFEAGFESLFSDIICVYAPLPIIIERVIARDGVTKEQVLARVKNQMDSEEKIRRSHFTINADGIHALIPQVLAIHKKLMC